MENSDDEKHILITRSSVFCRITESEGTKEKKDTAPQKSCRNIRFIKCMVHSLDCSDTWTKQNSECKKCMLFPSSSQLPLKRLPTAGEALSYYITMKSEAGKGGMYQDDPLYQTATDLMMHWVFCNVYTVGILTVKKRLKELFDEYTKLKNYSKKKRGTTFQTRADNFGLKCEHLFDIRADEKRSKQQESVWGVVMSKLDKNFYELQKLCPQQGYCDTFVERKWKISMENKRIREEKAKERLNKSIQEIDAMKGVQWEDNDISDEDGPSTRNGDDEYNEAANNDCDDKEGLSPAPKKRCRGGSYIPSTEIFNDSLPMQYRYVRKSERVIRPEVYMVLTELKSKYHMSERQAEGAIVLVANSLFGRNWRTHEDRSDYDRNTLPCSSNSRRVENCVEAATLAAIADEMMNEDNEATITYSHDGSAKSGVGSFIVQSLTINGVQRALPTMGIHSETRENLKDLQITMYKMLSVASGHKYSTKDLMGKVKYVMTDSTSHNLKVTEAVCEELGIEEEKIPKTLLCNVHPLMMFQGKLKKVFQQIHDLIGNHKIKECFLVDTDFRSESFIWKSIRCLNNFISVEYSAKPWNRQKDFETFIDPKKNKSISLKDHRFNRLSDCCLSLVYHLEDITKFLEKFQNVTNGIAILDRSFVEMEILMPIYCTVALLGHHFTRPFHALLLHEDTTYSVLLDAFPKLYNDLLSVDPQNLLSLSQVCTFVNEEIFTQSKSEIVLLQNLEQISQEHGTEVQRLLKICLAEFAAGFALQKGAIFGFGDEANNDTGTVMKISDVSKEELEVLDNIQIHNLNEERSVGFVNYEIGIRGKANLNCVSKKMVLNKSFDLLKSLDTIPSFKHFSPIVQEIKEYKTQWNDKMKALQEKGYTEKELLNLKNESDKLKDLEFLKTQIIPGPFTTPDEVQSYIDTSTETDVLKNKRMYVEVRYARKTSLSLKESASVFRLKRNNKNLPTEEYVDNLCHYLSDSRSKSTLSTADLNRVLIAMDSTTTTMRENDEIEVAGEKDDEDVEFSTGDHVVAIWLDDDGEKENWHLGVVESYDGKDVSVAYFIRSDSKNNKSWIFPEETKLQLTSPAQIIARGINVAYRCSTRIRCEILNKELVKELDNVINERNYVNNLTG